MGDPATEKSLAISCNGLMKGKTMWSTVDPLQAPLDLRGSTVLEIVLTFIRPIHESASYCPVGGYPEIGAPSYVFCRGSLQKQAFITLFIYYSKHFKSRSITVAAVQFWVQCLMHFVMMSYLRRDP